jgi:NAD+ synthetase
VNIIIPTINTTIGDFAGNKIALQETLKGVSLSQDTSVILVHPYVIYDPHIGRIQQHPSFDTCSLYDNFSAILTLEPPVVASGRWSVAHKIGGDTIRIELSSVVDVANLNITTNVALATHYATCLEQAKAQPWIIFMLDAYSQEEAQACYELALKLEQATQQRVLMLGALGTSNDLLFAGDIVHVHKGRSQYRFCLENQYAVVDTEKADMSWQSDKKHFDFFDPLVARHYSFSVFGLADFVHKSGFSKIHLGLSGGVDSALVAALAVAALGCDNVVGILMPSEYSSSHSVSDAEKLAENLKIKYQSIPIKVMHQQLHGFLDEHFKLSTLADENLQARLRGLYLMTYANSTGSFLLTTGNKSEVACGYGTLYGDMCGAYNPIGDMYKTEVYAVCRYINEQAKQALIPENILTKAPSAELREGQFDQETLPAYDLLDNIIESILQRRYKHQQIASQLDTSLEEVVKVATLIRKSEFKRWQAAPILKLSTTHMGSTRSSVLLSQFVE